MKLTSSISINLYIAAGDITIKLFLKATVALSDISHNSCKIFKENFDCNSYTTANTNN